MSADRYSFVCAKGCGVCRVKLAPFEYERTETLEGELLGSKVRPQVVSACCGADVHAYDNDTDEWGDLVDVTPSAPGAPQEAAAVPAVGQWQDIATAPKDGTLFIAYRPLAALTHDPVISMVHGTARSRGCWKSTVPSGMDDTNFTTGYCKATHWQPLPAPPGAALAGGDGGEGS